MRPARQGLELELQDFLEVFDGHVLAALSCLVERGAVDPDFFEQLRMRLSPSLDIFSSSRFQLRMRLSPSLVETLSLSNYRHTAIPIMAALLDSSKREPPPVRRAALEGLVQTRARDELVAIQPADAAEAELLARGLGFVDVSVQSRLLELLDHSDDRVRCEAAVALGRIGDLGAVASLRKVAGSGSLFRSVVARAAESAIADLQSRAGGFQAGEISLASVEPLQGAVSPADAEDTPTRAARSRWRHELARIEGDGPVNRSQSMSHSFLRGAR